jgi:hypothetical protein
MEIPDGEGTTNAYISTYIMMDYTQRNSVRRVMTFPMVFADTGGFMTITFLVTVIIVERLQTIIYYSTLIKNLYKYQNEDDNSN